MKNEMRRILRTDFLAFARKALYEMDGTKVSHDPYLEVIASKLMDFADGKTKRLLINVPPRHLKTDLGSVCLGAWIFADKPNARIMVLAYSEELAEKISRSIRSILRADWFKQVFDTRVAKDHAKVRNFGTRAGGKLYAASIHGSITGFGADIIIVDDPHNIRDAGNPEQLKDTIEQFEGSVMSRRDNRKTGRVMVIAHRIHDEDLSAHLLASGRWEHVVLPLIATRDQTYDTVYGPWHRRKGSLLQPDADDLDEVERLRATLVNPSFDLLYQQDADGQALPPITAEHFPSYRPGSLCNVRYLVSVDAGFSKGDKKSFSVIQVWAYDANNYYLVNQYRERCDFHDLARMTRRLAKCDRHCAIIIEEAANGHALLSELTRKQRKRVHGIPPRGSKAARFRPHIAKILAGRVQLPFGAPFRSGFVQELSEFPHGRHSDQVDAFSQAMTWIDEQGPRDPLPMISSLPVSMVVGHNSQFAGFNQRGQLNPNAPATMVVSGHSSRMPNAPFPTVKAWVKY